MQRKYAATKIKITLTIIIPTFSPNKNIIKMQNTAAKDHSIIELRYFLTSTDPFKSDCLSIILSPPLYCLYAKIISHGRRIVNKFQKKKERSSLSFYVNTRSVFCYRQAIVITALFDSHKLYRIGNVIVHSHRNNIADLFAEQGFPNGRFL